VKPFLRSGDFWSGLVLAALGAYIVASARGWTYTSDEGPGAGFFPMWYGGVMVVLSLALVLGAVLKPQRRPDVVWKDVGRAMASWFAFVACVAAMPYLGFVISFALLTFFIVKVMCGERVRNAIAVAVIGAAGFYAIFDWALDLSLPQAMFL
jgi:putative tricarboxylic transport membrane protein